MQSCFESNLLNYFFFYSSFVCSLCFKQCYNKWLREIACVESVVCRGLGHMETCALALLFVVVVDFYFEYTPSPPLPFHWLGVIPSPKLMLTNACSGKYISRYHAQNDSRLDSPLGFSIRFVGKWSDKLQAENPLLIWFSRLESTINIHVTWVSFNIIHRYNHHNWKFPCSVFYGWGGAKAM